MNLKYLIPEGHHCRLLVTTRLLSSRTSRSPVEAVEPGLFAGLFPLPNDTEAFYDKVLSIEGDIFEACTVSWSRMKSTIPGGLWCAASDFDGQSAVEVSLETILKVAVAVAAAEDAGIRVESIHREIARIFKLETTISLQRELIN